MLLVIPAIDLLGGRCVRLHQGVYEDETVYYDDPVQMACLLRVMNTKFLHLVDLDAARGGSHDRANNRDVIAEICKRLDIPVELGGGIRTMEDVEAAVELGISRIIIGTAAVRNPDLVEEAIGRYGSSRIAVGIDARDGEVRLQGWLEGSGVDAVDLALEMERRGCRRIIYTDISRDGTLAGPNVEAYKQLGSHLTKSRITASGGVGGYQDLVALQGLAQWRVDSVIVGKALYENRFPCQQFWCWHQKQDVALDEFSTAQLRSCS